MITVNTSDCTVDVPHNMNDSVMGGTTMAALLGASEYMSPFMAKLSLIGAYKTASNPAMKLGQTMEEDIIRKLEKTHGPIQRFPAIPEGDDYSNWPYHLAAGHFGAHLDGLLPDTIVEVKTTSSPGKWVAEDGAPTIPGAYYIQASLYAWLVKCSDILFAVGVVHPGDYQTPDEIPQYELVELHVRPMHIVFPDIWETYLNKCISIACDLECHKPIEYDPDDERDVKVIRELTKTSVESDPLTAMLDRLFELNAQAKAITAESDEIKKKVKLTLALSTDDGGKTTAQDSAGRVWTYTRLYKPKTDYKKACEDNEIDMSEYTTKDIEERLDSPKEPKKKEE